MSQYQSASLTDSEMKILSGLSSLVAEFRSLPIAHPLDVSDFESAIRSAENVVLSRVGYRSMTERDGSEYSVSRGSHWGNWQSEQAKEDAD